ncbi:hypothetical protein EC988_005936, partial [Linderina pennispora]
TRTNLIYLDQLYKFHSQQGHPLTKVPQLDHRPIDMFDLRNEVNMRGGFHKVNSEKRWAEIGRVMKYDRKTCTSMSNSLKSTYQKIILPFELYLAKHGGSVLTSPLRNGTTAEGTPGTDSLENDEHEEGGVRRSKRRRPAKPSSGIRESSAVASREATPSSVHTPPPPPAQADGTGASSKRSREEKGPDYCEVCRSGEHGEVMLICDGCEKGFHMGCLEPPVHSVPSNDWYCDACVLTPGADFGFEDGGEYTLDAFKRKSDDFKRKWFSEYYHGNPRPNNNKEAYLYGPQMEGRVPEEVVEEEFWRLVATPYEEVEVEYGADLHSAQHGSGFPTAERDPLEPYARHPWNLTMLPFQPASLFNHIQQDISGMMTPWIYVGMCFSTFCWHNEDHYTFSVNYQHWGDTKTWYGVPGQHAEMFEQAMRDAVPQLFEDQPDLLFQLVTMLSPEVLLNRNVDVFTVDQRAGEFVVTFPQSYHSGFNQGLNFNEAVNFATPDWMPYDIMSVKRYQQYARNPVFSHDELLVTMLENDREYLQHQWFQDALVEMVNRELEDRKFARALWPAHKIQEIEWEPHDDTEAADELQQQ